jgi:hypothetical protein
VNAFFESGNSLIATDVVRQLGSIEQRTFDPKSVGVHLIPKHNRVKLAIERRFRPRSVNNCQL